MKYGIAGLHETIQGRFNFCSPRPTVVHTLHEFHVELYVFPKQRANYKRYKVREIKSRLLCNFNIQLRYDEYLIKYKEIYTVQYLCNNKPYIV